MFTVNEILYQHYPQITHKPWLFKPAKLVLSYLLHEQDFNDFSTTYPHLNGLDFVEQILEHFNVSYSVHDTEKERIPCSGRCVIIANHPIGTLDGLALLKLISEVRQDIKIIANQMLMAVKPLHSMMLPVDNMGTGTVKENLSNIQKHLASEGVVIIFPAGEVSRLRPQGVRDTEWQSGFLRIAKKAQAPILPLLIEAKNSPTFYGASMLYKPLATLLIIREMFKKERRHFPIRIGELIPVSSYIGAKISIKQQVKLFKKHLYRLNSNKRPIFETQKGIALPEDRRNLQAAMQSDCQRLGTTSDNKEIYLYRYKGSSPILREIGRLREIAFRAVGEGSNKRRDIDAYDNNYFHLVLWDNKDLEIVGAYRFGDAKKLVSKSNNKDLYSASLFKYDEAMKPYFEQGLELGRSFIQPKYWGKRNLDYLWYGIGAFLKHHPEYRYLFGPVSLSHSYPETAKNLIVYFYQHYFGGEHHLAQSNSPYQLPVNFEHPFKGDDYKADFAELKYLLSSMGVAVPTLYKQYCEICEPGGAKFLSFGVDPDFNNCVDGLILVDLAYLKDSKRRRYMDDVSELPT